MDLKTTKEKSKSTERQISAIFQVQHNDDYAWYTKGSGFM